MKSKQNIVSALTSIILTACLFFSISTPNKVLAADDIALTASKNLSISATQVTKSVIDYGSSKETTTSIVNKIEIPQEKFDVNYYKNPLSHKSCEGYSITRGWSSGHTGVDMQKKGGCWISAVAAGDVVKVGMCEGGLGYCVEILHDNGYRSLYAHGSGEFTVEEGFRVNPGDRIMYMGCTGKCTGTHLHFSIARPGSSLNYSSRINPVGIVPLD